MEMQFVEIFAFFIWSTYFVFTTKYLFKIEYLTKTSISNIVIVFSIYW